MQKKDSGFVARWFCNGANLITLARIPCIVAIMFYFIPLVRGDPDWYWVSPQSLFVAGAFFQGLGMILDGLDGWWARKVSSIGPTSEGQFLDQFVDKIFVWVIWFAICSQMYDGSWKWIALWWVPSLFLFSLDTKSCIKHWRNYVANRGKPVNLTHGAKWQGKWKFLFENVVICMNLLALCPAPVASLDNFSIHVFGWLHWTGSYFHAWASLPLFIAIALACWSLRSRGVKVLRRNKLEEPMRLQRYADASTAIETSDELDPV